MRTLTDKNITQQQGTVVMLGNFDGLHAGHQRLLSTLKATGLRTGLQTVVFSFYPHPVSFLTKTPFPTIYSQDEKAHLLEQAGIDLFVAYPFDESLAKCSPQDFVLHILYEQLKCQEVVIGQDYHFGSHQAGTPKVMQEIAQPFDMSVRVVPLLLTHGQKISSTIIRQHIQQAQFREAAQLLTRPYFIRGPVVHGKKLGRTLGYHTANLPVSVYKLLPPNGVYATETLVQGKAYKSITSVGVNPTVAKDSPVSVETHIQGFAQDIYGETIQVNFHKRIRSEMRFDSLSALRRQIDADVQCLQEDYLIRLH